MADGGGGGRGGGRGASRRDQAAGIDDAEHAEFVFKYDVEAYHGEQEDIQFLESLLSEPTPPSPLEEILGHAPMNDPSTSPQPEVWENVDLYEVLSTEVSAEDISVYLNINVTEQKGTSPNISLPSSEEVSPLLQQLGQQAGEDGLHLPTQVEPVAAPLHFRPEAQAPSADAAAGIYPNVNENERDEAPLRCLNLLSSPLEQHQFFELREQELTDNPNFPLGQLESMAMHVPPQPEIAALSTLHHEDQHSLEGCMREGKWECALRHLDRMVREGEAENGAVEMEVPWNDIHKAHPELVLWLRGQRFFEIYQEGGAAAAQVYYQQFIHARYPDGNTGSFADKTIIKSIRVLARTGVPPGGEQAFIGKEKTSQRIKDYLRVYFPAYRPAIRQGTSKIWEFGEKDGDVIRCLVCHKDVKGSSLRKLRLHLVGLGGGKQGKCHGVTGYIRGRLLEILADEGYNPDGSVQHHHGPAPPQPGPPQDYDEGHHHGAADPPPLRLPPPPDDDDDGGGDSSTRPSSVV